MPGAPTPHRLGALAQAAVVGLAGLGAAALLRPAFADDLVLASRPVGECALSVERSTQEPHVLRVRTFHPKYLGCTIDPTALVAVLEQAVGTANEAQTGPFYSTISLGRLVDHPWLSAHLARTAAADPRWNRRTGRPHREDINHYVAELLSGPAVTDRLQPALTAAGYRITHATVEKVLVARAQEIPALGAAPEAAPGAAPGAALGTGLGDTRLRGRLPFDAMLWFRLQAR